MKDIQKQYEKAFGTHLKTLLIKYNKDAITLAAHANLEPKQIYRVLNAEHSTSLGILFCIAKGLGVHPKELFDFEFSAKKQI